MKVQLWFGCFTVISLLLLASNGWTANIDRFSIPEVKKKFTFLLIIILDKQIPAQHNVLKQKVINEGALQKFKACVNSCAYSEIVRKNCIQIEWFDNRNFRTNSHMIKSRASKIWQPSRNVQMLVMGRSEKKWGIQMKW